MIKQLKKEQKQLKKLIKKITKRFNETKRIAEGYDRDSKELYS